MFPLLALGSGAYLLLAVKCYPGGPVIAPSPTCVLLAQIWDPDAGWRVVKSLRVHTGQIHAVTACHDVLITGGSNGSLVVRWLLAFPCAMHGIGNHRVVRCCVPSSLLYSFGEAIEFLHRCRSRMSQSCTRPLRCH